MIETPGYTVTDYLNRGKTTSVFRAIRDHDGKTVILKVLQKAFCSDLHTTLFDQEYETLVSIYKTTLSQDRLIERIRLDGQPCIVFDDSGSTDLEKCLNLQPHHPLKTLYKAALHITIALGEVHAKGYIHRNLSPDNILLNETTLEIRLADFGTAVKQGQNGEPPAEMVHLAYTSPELTGRIGKEVDYRADFYSLGAVLYRLFSGTPPFPETDTGELIHAHIAKKPPLLHEARPDIPEALSVIIRKLMEKDPENRYQCIDAIISDLTYCAATIATGSTTEFTPGGCDTPGRLQFTEELYGRKPETDKILAAFELSLNQPGSLIKPIIVSGPSGSGKTSVVEAFIKKRPDYSSYYIKGKFDQYTENSTPFSAFTEAFSSLISQILTEADIETWKNRLKTAIGLHSGLLTNLVPDLEILTGKPVKTPSLPPAERENLLLHTITRFITTCATPEHPLILFLDDLQWIDSASLKLFEHLALTCNRKGVFILGAYRDDEVPQESPLIKTFENLTTLGVDIMEIRLTGLSSITVNQMVADLLGVSADRSRSLSRLTHSLTNGNPFHIREYLTTLQQDNLLKFNHMVREWQWDDSLIPAGKISDSVVALVAKKMERLPDEEKRILMLAACLGGSFSTERLSDISGDPLETVSFRLAGAVISGFIRPTISDSNRKKEFLFSHDKIQEAAYSLIPTSNKADYHYEIGSQLLTISKNQDETELLYTVAGQFNKAITLFKSDAQKKELGEINLRAGQAAKQNSAYSSAFRFFETGITLLSDSAWETDYQLTSTLYAESAETAYLTGRFDISGQRIQSIRQNACNDIDIIRASGISIQADIARNSLTDAVREAVSALSVAGIQIPEKPGRITTLLAMIKILFLARQKSIYSRITNREMSDPKALAAMRILSTAFIAGYIASPASVPFFILESINLTCRRGRAPESAFASACLGLLFCGTDKIDLGLKYGRLAMKLNDLPGAENYKAKILFMVNCFILHWAIPYRKTLPAFRQTYDAGIETGDIEYAAYGSFVESSTSFLCGIQLKELRESMPRNRDEISGIRNMTALHMHEIYHQTVINLTEPFETPWILDGNAYNENRMVPIHKEANDLTSLCHVYINKMILCTVFRRFSEGLGYADKAISYLEGLMAANGVPSCIFYDSMVRLNVLPYSSESKQQQLLKQIRKNLALLKKWSGQPDSDFRHKYYLVKAEWMRFTGDTRKSADYYEKAILIADQNGYIHEKAIAIEAAAFFHKNNGEPVSAKNLLKEAFYCYTVWGATAKTDQMKADYPELFGGLKTDTEQFPPDQSIRVAPLIQSSGSVSSFCDLTTLVNATRTISDEIELPSLLRKLTRIVLQNAGADTCHLILKYPEGFFIEASGKTLPETVSILKGAPVEESDQLPESIINYVKRTEKPVAIENAAVDPVFSKDPYVKKRRLKSILCLPVTHKSRLTGILYLENNAVRGAFTQDRLEMMNLLAGQIAISVENARLYAEMTVQKKEIGEINRNLEKEIAERRLAEEHYKSLFLNAAEGIFQADMDGNFINVNPAFLRITGFKNLDEIRAGYTIKNLFDVADAQFKKLQKGKNLNDYETVLSPQKGKPVSISLNIHLVEEKTNRDTRFQGSITDITPQKEAVEIKALKDAAEAVANAKTRFLAHISHEIRTPMNAIVALMEILSKTDLGEDQKSYINRIRTSSDALLSIVNSMLDFSKMEAGKMTLEETETHLKMLVRRVEDIFHARAVEKQILLSVELDNRIPDTIISDPIRLGQVLINLVDNAVKFTNQGHVRLNIDLKEQTGNQVTLIITVSDTGTGISPKQLETLFDLYSQAEINTGRKYGGTGLGLAICKQIADLMGGTINAQSPNPLIPDRLGTLFTFEAIFGYSTTTPKTVPEPETVAVRGISVLIVDDNEIGRNLLKMILAEKGILVTEADSGERAVNICRITRFDVILMDIAMPGIDGIEACRQIKTFEARNNLPETPIIAVTAHALEDEKKACMDAGMIDCLIKPLDFKALYQRFMRLRQSDKSPVTRTKKPGKATDMPPEAPFWTAVVHGIDLAGLFDRTEGDSALVSDLMTDYLNTYSDIIASLEAELDKQNIPQFRSRLHAFAGVAGNIGATEVLTISRRILDRKTTDMTVLEADFRSLKPAIQKSFESVSTLLNLRPMQPQSITGDPAELEMDQILPEANKIAELISANHIDAADHLNRIRPVLSRLGFRNEVIRIENQIQDIKFREAEQSFLAVLKKLKRIKKKIDHTENM